MRDAKAKHQRDEEFKRRKNVGSCASAFDVDRPGMPNVVDSKQPDDNRRSGKPANEDVRSDVVQALQREQGNEERDEQDRWEDEPVSRGPGPVIVAEINQIERQALEQADGGSCARRRAQ